jgi:hypothetical protein
MSYGFYDRIKSDNRIGWKGSEAWRGGHMKSSAEPELCHCGAKALYRHQQAGFCKAHHADAVAASQKSKGCSER